MDERLNNLKITTTDEKLSMINSYLMDIDGHLKNIDLYAQIIEEQLEQRDRRLDTIRNDIDNIRKEFGEWIEEICKTVKHVEEQFDMRSEQTDSLFKNGYATFRWSRVYPVPYAQRTDEGIKYCHPPHFPRTVDEFWELGLRENTKLLLQLLTFYRIYAHDDLEGSLEEHVAHNREAAHSKLAYSLNLKYEKIRFQIAQESPKQPYQDSSTESAKVEVSGNDLPQTVAPHQTPKSKE